MPNCCCDMPFSSSSPSTRATAQDGQYKRRYLKKQEVQWQVGPGMGCRAAEPNPLGEMGLLAQRSVRVLSDTQGRSAILSIEWAQDAQRFCGSFSEYRLPRCVLKPITPSPICLTFTAAPSHVTAAASTPGSDPVAAMRQGLPK